MLKTFIHYFILTMLDHTPPYLFYLKILYPLLAPASPPTNTSAGGIRGYQGVFHIWVEKRLSPIGNVEEEYWKDIENMNAWTAQEWHVEKGKQCAAFKKRTRRSSGSEWSMRRSVFEGYLRED